MAGAESELLVDFSIILAVAALIVLLFYRLRLPTVLGYLLAGVLIGPYVPYLPTVANVDTIDALADLAIIVIMFSLGLSFSFSRLRSTGMVAAATGTVVIVAMVLVGYTLGLALGWGDMDSFFLGAMMAISSTAVITKGIMDRDAKEERSSQIVTGVLIVEDLAVVVILALIAGISSTGELRLEGLLTTVVSIALFVVLFMAFGFVVAPRLARYAADTGSRELVLMAALGLCFGFALLAYWLGFSPAIGAFVAGAVLGDLPQRERITREVRPVRDVFAAVFFISIGMLLDPAFLLEYWLPALLVAVVFIAVKSGLLVGVTFTFGTSARTALQVGLMMTVMGEFSFIIARAGTASGVIDEFLYPTIVAASMMTIVAGTLLTRRQDAVIGGIERRAPPSVKRFAAFLTLSINQLAARAAVSGRLSESARRDVKEVLLDAVLVMAAALGLRLVLAFSSDILSVLGLPEGALRTLELVAVAVALVFIIVFLAALARRLLHLMGEAALPMVRSDGGRTSRRRTVAYQSLRALAGLAALAGATLVVLFVAAPYAPTPVLLLALLVPAVAFALAFRSSVHTFNERFRETFKEGIRVKEAPEAIEGDEGVGRVPDLHPEELLRQGDRLRSVVVEPAGGDAGRRLGETELASRGDVAVLAIRRDGGLVIDPSREEELREGDVLVYLEGCAALPGGGGKA